MMSGFFVLRGVASLKADVLITQDLLPALALGSFDVEGLPATLWLYGAAGGPWRCPSQS